MDLTLDIDAFVRSVDVNQKSPHALFLGAGSSITSGVASATTCIWEWKKKIFLTKNPGLESQFADISLPSLQRRIQQWLNSEGTYPKANSFEEYSRFAELCFPISDDRRQYFQNLTANVKPHLGYQLACLLAQAGILKATWTTNFDQLITKAAAHYNIIPIEIGLDSSERALRRPRDGEILSVALHGDYRYDSLKNTQDELRKQNANLSNAFIHYVKDASLIVVGYSGRDESIMQMMTKAYSTQGPGRLYWCGFEEAEPDENIKNLIDVARANGREAFYISASGFDDLIRRLSLACLSDGLLTTAQQLCTTHIDKCELPPFKIPDYPTGVIIRSNLFPIQCPTEILQFKLAGVIHPKPWEFLRDKTKGTGIVADTLKGNVIAFGTIDEINNVFGDQLEDKVRRVPIDDKELSMANGVVVSLLERAITKAFADAYNCTVEGKNLLWQSNTLTQQVVYNKRCNVYSAVKLRLRLFSNKLYLAMLPTIIARDPLGNKLSDDADKELKRKVLGTQWNKEFSDALNKWQKLLLPNQSNTLEFPANVGSSFSFTIRKAATLAKIGEINPRYPVRTGSVLRLCSFSGMQLEEPKLLFSNKNGSGFTTDTHPIRGILQNQPYDFAVTSREIVPEVRIGVVCPTPDAPKLARYLSDLHQSCGVIKKPEYLLDYPGFSQAFGLPIDVPNPHSSAWHDCAEPSPGGDATRASQELRESITKAITALEASGKPTVVIIYIPNRWQDWLKYCHGRESFDLHNFVKAFCVQKGIASQFLREETLNKTDQGEIRWWLGLSFYTKSMLTPWVLETLNHDTAYLGLGYSVDPLAGKGNNITLGCSHIYSADGRGLKYRLRRLDDVTFDRQGNPFMSKDDARRLGENVRQLFYESAGELPKRVVIHKRNYYRTDEIEGLLEGLHGVDNVDMLEINIEDILRYTATRVYPNGNVEFDGFPVKRGTTMVLDRRRALLWVHGTATSINPAKPSFYLGKSRIPAPLMVIRHYGKSELEILVREILGLSKMNWNTFDMYAKLPATVQSSNIIAQIGTLLERFGPNSYDYRLFI